MAVEVEWVMVLIVDSLTVTGRECLFYIYFATLVAARAHLASVPTDVINHSDESICRRKGLFQLTVQGHTVWWGHQGSGSLK